MFTQEVVNAIAAALYCSVLVSIWLTDQAKSAHQSVRTATLRMDGVNWLSRSGQTKSEVRRMLTQLGKKDKASDASLLSEPEGGHVQVIDEQGERSSAGKTNDTRAVAAEVRDMTCTTKHNMSESAHSDNLLGTHRRTRRSPRRRTRTARTRIRGRPLSASGSGALPIRRALSQLRHAGWG